MFHLLLSQHQLWVAVIGALVPGVTYLLNHYAPWVGEPVKAVIHVVVAAVAAGLYAALATTHFGLNLFTLQLVGTSVLAAFAAHHWFWTPSTIAAKLGAGRNHADCKR